MSRFVLSNRIVIEMGLYARKSFQEIAKELQCSPGSVSREIRKNRTLVQGERICGKNCKHSQTCRRRRLCGDMDCPRKCVHCKEYDCQKLCSTYSTAFCSRLITPPYVCNTCLQRKKCKQDRAYYIAQQADAVSGRRNAEARSKVHADKEALKTIDRIVSPLVKRGQPLSHICMEHGAEIGVSLRTLYRYIDQGLLSIGNLDLRRKVGYKARKKRRQPSDGILDQEYRKDRGYEDYLKYMEQHPDAIVVQMDTVHGCRERGKRLLTLHFCDNNLMLILLMRDGKADTVVEQFDLLTGLLGVEEFSKIFQVILTDNGSEFKRTRSLELLEDGTQRTRVFYCDPQASWQKPKIEKNHEYIRYVLHKGESFNPYTQRDMTILANNINSIRRLSLHGKTPYEATTDSCRLHMLELLGMYPIPADEVKLTKDIFKRS